MAVKCSFCCIKNEEKGGSWLALQQKQALILTRQSYLIMGVMKATEKLWRNGKSLVGKRDGKTSTAMCLLQVPTIVGLIPTTPPFLFTKFSGDLRVMARSGSATALGVKQNWALVEKRRFQS